VASSSLRHHVNHVNISSTEELVSAANVAPEQQRKDFGEWLEKYVEWFVNKKAFVVNKDALMEYALLSKLNPEISEYKDFLRRWLQSFCDQIVDSKFGTNHLLMAFTSALMTANSAAFEDEIETLIRVADHLVSKVDPKATALTPETYQVHQLNLNSAYRVMLTIRDVSPRQLNPDIVDGPYQRLKKVLEEVITESRQCYPYHYCAEIVKHSLAGMEMKAENRTEGTRKNKRMVEGIYGVLRVYQGLREIAELKLDPEAIKDGFQSIQKALDGNNISKMPWCNLIEKLDYGCMLVVQQPTYAGELFDVFDQLIKDSSSSDDRMFRFGIVEELIFLINNSGDPSVHVEAWTRLLSIGRMCYESTESQRHNHTIESILQFVKSVDSVLLPSMSNDKF